MTATGASKALRGATNRLAKKLGKTPKHTKSPRADFDRMLTNVRDARRVAEYYYKMGMRRGLIKATDYVADGKIIFDKNGTLLADSKIASRRASRVARPNGRPSHFSIRCR